MSEQEPRRPRLEDREVRVADPHLSDSANDRLTEEVREVIGTDHVRVPVDRPHFSLGEQPPPSGLLTVLVGRWIMIAIIFAMFVTIGAIVSLSTGDWWFLVLAAGVHAAGTLTVAAIGLRMMTTMERPEPTTVALLEEEGIRNAEEHFSRLVAEFTHGEDRTTAEVLSSGANERTVEAQRDPVTAAKEQQSAMTATSGPSRPAAFSSTMWGIIIAIAVISIVIPVFFGGGWLWLLAAVMLPIVGGWAMLMRVMTRDERQPQAALKTDYLPVMIIAATVVSVAIFCGVVAFAFQH